MPMRKYRAMTKNRICNINAVLESFCAKQGWQYEIIQDLGSGLNYCKKVLKKLIKEICLGTVELLVITHN